MPSAAAIARSSGVVINPRTKFSIRADVDGRHRDRGDIAARILAHVKRLHRLQSSDENHEADDHRQYRALDEKIGEDFI